MTHTQRPDCSRQSLAALAMALSHPGVDVAQVGLFVEPGNAEVIELCESFAARAIFPFLGPPRTLPACGCEVKVNPTRLGVNANTAQAIDWGFAQGADFVTHVEDDVCLAPDGLAYFAWAAEAFKDDPTIASVTGYNRLQAMPPPSTWHTVQSRAYFHPWSVGFWRDSWQALRHATESQRWTWDCVLLREMQRRRLREVYPVLSRCQNIGRHSSIYGDQAPPPSWYDEHHFLRVHAGLVTVPSGTFNYEGGK